MSATASVPVDLYIYDLTNGLAAMFSPALLGQQMSGVWHTAVVVYGREYFFGGGGVTCCAPGSTQLGAPQRVQRLGHTGVPFPLFLEFIQGLATTTFAPGTYHLLRHNCNHFSEEVAQFLCGGHVPAHVLLQPAALPPALRLALGALLDNIAPDAQQAVYADGVRQSRRESPEYCSLNEQVELVRAAGLALGARRSTLAAKLARRDRNKRKKRLQALQQDHDQDQGDQQILNGDGAEETTERRAAAGGDMAEALVEEAASAAPGAAPGDSLERRRSAEMQRRQTHPPIVFKNIDAEAELAELEKAIEGMEGEAGELARRSADELRQYLLHGEGSWVLGDDFLQFIGDMVSRADSACGVRALRLLSCCALREDVALLLHQDRRHHALLNYAHRIDSLTTDEQEAIGLFMCNLFENVSPSEWLLYISEWEHKGTALSNIRVTTKVCVHLVLGEEARLREVGGALLHNIAAKERLRAGAPLRHKLPPHAKSKVFDEVCVELAMAGLQALSVSPAEPQCARLVFALARLALHSPDVPQLIAMVGPDPEIFRGTSARVDEQLDLLRTARAAH